MKERKKATFYFDFHPKAEIIYGLGLHFLRADKVRLRRSKGYVQS